MTDMDINEILSRAGLKCTRQRVRVMEVLSNAPSPMSAEKIFAAAEDMSLSTVYRIVEKLCEKGIVSKSTIRNSDKFYYEMVADKHRHYAICLECGDMKYIDICPVHPPVIEDFTVTGHKLEIYGYCAKCRKAHNQ